MICIFCKKAFSEGAVIQVVKAEQGGTYQEEPFGQWTICDDCIAEAGDIETINVAIDARLQTEFGIKYKSLL